MISYNSYSHPLRTTIFLMLFLICILLNPLHAQQINSIVDPQNQTETQLSKPFGKVFDIKSNGKKITILIEGSERPDLGDTVYVKHNDSIIELKITGLTHTNAKAQIVNTGVKLNNDELVYLKKEVTDIISNSEHNDTSQPQKKLAYYVHGAWASNRVGQGIEMAFYLYPWARWDGSWFGNNQDFNDIKLGFFARSTIAKKKPSIINFPSMYNNIEIGFSWDLPSVGIEYLSIGYENIGYNQGKVFAIDSNPYFSNNLYLSSSLRLFLFRLQLDWGVISNGHFKRNVSGRFAVFLWYPW